MEVVGGISAIITIIDGVATLAKRLNEVRDKYENVALYITLACARLSSMRAALEAIREWSSNTSDTSDLSRQLHQDLDVSLKCCAILIDVINAKLGEAGYTTGLKEKIRYLWLEDTLKEYISNLEGQVGALSLLLSIFQCRTAVEQNRRLELTESRAIIKRVCDETTSLSLRTADSRYSVDLLSQHPSFHLEVDSILLRSGPYVNAYGKAQRHRANRKWLDSSASSKPNHIHVELPHHGLNPRNESDIESSHTTGSVQVDRRTSRESQESESARDDRKIPLNGMDAIEIPSSGLCLPSSRDLDQLYRAAKTPAVTQDQNNSPSGTSSPKQRHIIGRDPIRTPCNSSLSPGFDQHFTCSISSSNQNDHFAPGIPTSASTNPESSDRKSQILDLERKEDNDHYQESLFITLDEGEIGSQSPSTHSDLYERSIALRRSESLPKLPEMLQGGAPVNPSHQESVCSRTGDLMHNKKSSREILSALPKFQSRDAFPIKAWLSLPPARSFDYQPELNRRHTENPSSLAILRRNRGHDAEILACSDTATPETTTASTLCQDSEFSSSPAQNSHEQQRNHNRTSNSNDLPTSTQAQSSDTLGSQPPLNAVEPKIQYPHSTAGSNAVDPRVPRKKSRNAAPQAADSEKLYRQRKRTKIGKLQLVWPLLSSFDSSALFASVERGNSATLNHLLDVTRININTRNESFKTLQMQAAVHSQIPCLEVLQSRGADQFAVNRDGRTVLHLTVEAKQVEVVSWLLRAYAPSSEEFSNKSSRFFRASGFGSRVRPFKSFLDASDKRGFTALHIAALVSCDKAVRLLAEAGSDINSRNTRDYSPLHEAALSNSYTVASALISHGAQVNAVDSESRQITSLHLAAYSGNHEVVALLVDSGANRLRYDSRGNMPIHRAAWSGHLKAVEELIGERMDLTAKTRYGATLLHIAVLRNNINLAQYVLQHDVDINLWATYPHVHFSAAIQSKMQKREMSLSWIANIASTPLHYSCYIGDVKFASLLLDHGAWVNAATKDGMTPLMMAVHAENLNLVCLLLLYGAKVNASVPGTRLTALDLANARGNQPIVQELIKRGAVTNAKVLHRAHL